MSAYPNAPKYPFYGAGAAGNVDVVKAGGIKSVGKIVFTGNLVAGNTFSVNGVVFTCMASGATGELQFNVDSTLALSLAALAVALNACTNVLVSRFTFAVADTNTSITVTGDNYSSADNDVVIASNHSTVVVTPMTGGHSRPNADLQAGTTKYAVSTGTVEAYLNDGVEGQVKSFSQTGGGVVNLKGAHLPGSTVNYALGDGDALVLQYLGAKWRLIVNDGATAS